MSDNGRPLPKFGEWDVNDPASAEGFTVIFNKARDEKRTGGQPESPANVENNVKPGVEPGKPQTDYQFRYHLVLPGPSVQKKWFCCLQAPHAES